MAWNVRSAHLKFQGQEISKCFIRFLRSSTTIIASQSLAHWVRATDWHFLLVTAARSRDVASRWGCWYPSSWTKVVHSVARTLKKNKKLHSIEKGNYSAGWQAPSPVFHANASFFSSSSSFPLWRLLFYLPVNIFRATSSKWESLSSSPSSREEGSYTRVFSFSSSRFCAVIYDSIHPD